MSNCEQTPSVSYATYIREQQANEGLETLSIDQEKFSGTYAAWMGIPVFLNVIAGGIKTSLFCTIIGESNATVRVRIGNQWDVDIYKEMVLAVDEFSHAGYGPSH